MAPWGHFMWQVYLAWENTIVQSILRRPGFHRVVQRIHRQVEDFKYGRHPDEPLRPGEATADTTKTNSKFLEHFVDELRNQWRGTPTQPPPGPPKK
ncbi:hypothetical protein NKR23_g5787 [Pleurostoma richardsiae]|uniref:Uncharacterized protein n=1 Tax=Pleurostoma richardsiae TaxID=41990 RepID=A0AA38VEP4_9PEZI|nr:hypothetical protein NKR23_g5787 [Pleurostoma richardsiae]